MKKLLVVVLVFVAFQSHGQNQVKYVHKKSSDEALSELVQKTRSDITKFQSALTALDSLESSGKVVLSTREYAFIRSRIINRPQNPTTSNEMEEVAYVDKAKLKYIVVTDLIK